MIYARRAVCILCLSFLVASLFAPASGGENFKYESRGRRDPFVPLVGIDRPTVSRLEDVTSIADIKLEGIASSSKGNFIAVLNGEIVKEGNKFGDIEIKKITKKTVTIVMGGKSYDKELAEEGGIKGER